MHFNVQFPFQPNILPVSTSASAGTTSHGRPDAATTSSGCYSPSTAHSDGAHTAGSAVSPSPAAAAHTHVLTSGGVDAPALYPPAPPGQCGLHQAAARADGRGCRGATAAISSLSASVLPNPVVGFASSSKCLVYPGENFHCVPKLCAGAPFKYSVCLSHTCYMERSTVYEVAVP